MAKAKAKNKARKTKHTEVRDGAMAKAKAEVKENKKATVKTLGEEIKKLEAQLKPIDKQGNSLSIDIKDKAEIEEQIKCLQDKISKIDVNVKEETKESNVSYIALIDFSHENGTGQRFDYKKGHIVAHSDIVRKHPYGEILVKGFLTNKFMKAKSGKKEGKEKGENGE